MIISHIVSIITHQNLYQCVLVGWVTFTSETSFLTASSYILLLWSTTVGILKIQMQEIQKPKGRTSTRLVVESMRLSRLSSLEI